VAVVPPLVTVAIWDCAAGVKNVPEVTVPVRLLERVTTVPLMAVM
jgi:hypothetical protein